MSEWLEVTGDAGLGQRFTGAANAGMRHAVHAERDETQTSEPID